LLPSSIPDQELDLVELVTIAPKQLPVRLERRTRR
jgi:hypothetical protein